MHVSSFFLLLLITTATHSFPYNDQQAYLAQLLSQLSQVQLILKDIEQLNVALDQNVKIVN